MRTALALLSLSLSLAACGGGSAGLPTGEEPAAPPLPLSPPPFMDGYFSTVRSVGAWPSDSTMIAVPSYSHDPSGVGKEMSQRNIWVWLSAHHCFANPPSQWEECWAKTKQWAAPLFSTGRVLGVYVIDEPFGGEVGGITPSHVEAAVARVRSEGYRTMSAEVYGIYKRMWEGQKYAPSVDFFGLTAYYGTKTEWVEDRMRENPRINLVFSSSDGDEEWEALAARTHARGLFRWSFDMGAAGEGRDPEAHSQALHHLRAKLFMEVR